jgi:hypothetical protein
MTRTTKRLIVLGALMLCAHSFQARADDQTEIKKALLQCASPKPSDCLSDDKLVVNILKVYGDYAHATLGHADGSGEIDDAYLKKENDHWKVLNEGAGLNAQELGIPKEAW